MGIFSVATIVCSWLTYQGVGERNQPVSLLTGGHPSCRPGGFFLSAASEWPAAQTDTGGVSEKSPPASAPVLH